MASSGFMLGQNARFLATNRILFCTTFRYYGRRVKLKGPPPLSVQVLRGFFAAQKSGDLNEAMKLFKELNSLNEKIPKDVMGATGAMLRMCIDLRDKEKGDEMIEHINQYYGSEPGVSLLTGKLNYYCAFEDHQQAWQVYKEMTQQNLPIRQSISFKLIELALKSKDHTHIGDILAKIKRCGAEMDDDISVAIFELATSEGVASPWQQFAKDLMDIYHSSCQLVKRDLADVMVRWMKSGKCLHCGSMLESTKLSDTEIDSLLQDTKLSLDEQVKSFEDSYKAAPEVKRLMMVCANTGPFGAVLDGLNVAGGNIDTQRLAVVAEWAAQYTKKPVLIVSRIHLAKYFKPRRTISELAYHYRKKNIYLFFTKNRVADDYYTIYSALASGRDTFVISNDKMGDHISRMDLLLSQMYRKWLRSVRINFSDEPESSILESLLLPQGYDRKVQQTDTHCHIPLVDELPDLNEGKTEWDDSEQWFCIKK